MEARIILKAKKDCSWKIGVSQSSITRSLKQGETITFYNNIFDAMNGIAFYPINRELFSIVAYDQYSGIKDKHGNKLYVQDIIKDGSVQYPYVKEVYWDERFQFAFRHIGTKQFMGSLSNNEFIIPEEMKIEKIGNIHDNPEFIEAWGKGKIL